MPQPLSISSHLALMKAGRARAEQEAALLPPPATPPQAYEVRIREGVGDTRMLIGHNGRGEPMTEWRVPKHLVTARMVERLGQWCRENDSKPDLHLAR